uniref:Uncharacterized protein n=1 Tax=Anguilla anguilla TaxID=7936 RepID=A0A0E9T7W9_ANGAN
MGVDRAEVIWLVAGFFQVTRQRGRELM